MGGVSGRPDSEREDSGTDFIAGASRKLSLAGRALVNRARYPVSAFGFDPWRQHCVLESVRRLQLRDRQSIDHRQ